MLLSLLAYLLLGLVLAWPLWHALRWLGLRSGLYTPRWKYLRAYAPAAAAADPTDAAQAAKPEEAA